MVQFYPLVNGARSAFTVNEGADGYVAFFTGPAGIAGDNDLFFDRATNKLKVNSQLLAADGTTAAPGLSFQSSTGSGLSISGTVMTLTVNGVTVAQGNSATQYHQFGGGSYYTLLGSQGGWLLYPAGGFCATGNSSIMWLQQTQDTVRDVRLIGSADAAGEYSARIGTKYTAGQSGNLAQLLQIGLDMDGTPVGIWEFTGAGVLQNASGNSIKWSTTTDPTGTADLTISRSAASVLQVDGYFITTKTQQENITTTATDYYANGSESIIAVTDTGSPRTVHLPDAANVSKVVMRIKDQSGGAAVNNITIKPADGAQTIDGAASVAISSNYGVKIVYSNGTAWFTS